MSNGGFQKIKKIILSFMQMVVFKRQKSNTFFHANGVHIHVTLYVEGRNDCTFDRFIETTN